MSRTRQIPARALTAVLALAAPALAGCAGEQGGGEPGGAAAPTDAMRTAAYPGDGCLLPRATCEGLIASADGLAALYEGRSGLPADTEQANRNVVMAKLVRLISDEPARCTAPDGDYRRLFTARAANAPAIGIHAARPVGPASDCYAAIEG